MQCGGRSRDLPRGLPSAARGESTVANTLSLTQGYQAEAVAHLGANKRISLFWHRRDLRGDRSWRGRPIVEARESLKPCLRDRSKDGPQTLVQEKRRKSKGESKRPQRDFQSEFISQTQGGSVRLSVRLTVRCIPTGLESGYLLEDPRTYRWCHDRSKPPWMTTGPPRTPEWPEYGVNDSVTFPSDRPPWLAENQGTNGGMENLDSLPLPCVHTTVVDSGVFVPFGHIKDSRQTNIPSCSPHASLVLAAKRSPSCPPSGRPGIKKVDWSSIMG